VRPHVGTAFIQILNHCPNAFQLLLTVSTACSTRKQGCIHLCHLAEITDNLPVALDDFLLQIKPQITP
jgi:hypothetical protein